MINSLRWGIMGTGGIARRFAAALPDSHTGTLAAVGSRSQESADAFAKDFPARAHATYEALLEDPEVEAVYIATPHPLHAEWAIRAAEHGKHILCEKPITMNLAEAGQVIAAAKKADVFLMEAFMYRCHPQTHKLIELLKEGLLGRVRMVQAQFCFRAAWKPEHRLLDRFLGGGGILDVGCYPVSMARLISGVSRGLPFDEPLEVRGLGEIGGTGVDEIAAAVLRFPDGMIAQVATGVRLEMDNSLRIWCDEGSIIVDTPWVHNREKGGRSQMRVHRPGKPAEEITIIGEQDIYAYEADVVRRCISARQAPEMSWPDTLGNMRVLDKWRADLGLRYDISSESGVS